MTWQGSFLAMAAPAKVAKVQIAHSAVSRRPVGFAIFIQAAPCCSAELCWADRFHVRLVRRVLPGLGLSGRLRSR